MAIISILIISCAVLLVGNVQSYPYMISKDEMLLLPEEPQLGITIEVSNDQDYVQELDYDNPYGYYSVEYEEAYPYQDYISNHDIYSLENPVYRANQKIKSANHSTDDNDERNSSRLTSLLETHCQTAITIRENIVKMLAEYLTKNDRAFILPIRSFLKILKNKEISTIYFNHNLYKLNSLNAKDIAMSLLHELSQHIPDPFIRVFSIHLRENPDKLKIFTQSIYKYLFLGVDQKVIRQLDGNNIIDLLKKIIKVDGFYVPPEYFSSVWFKIIKGFENGKVIPTPQLLGCFLMDIPLNLDSDLMRYNYKYTYNVLSTLNYPPKNSCEQDVNSLSPSEDSKFDDSTTTISNVELRAAFPYDQDSPDVVSEYSGIRDTYYDYSPIIRALSLEYPKESTKESTETSHSSIRFESGDAMNVLPLKDGAINGQSEEGKIWTNSYGFKTTLGGATIVKSMSTPNLYRSATYFNKEYDYNEDDVEPEARIDMNKLKGIINPKKKDNPWSEGETDLEESLYLKIKKKPKLNVEADDLQKDESFKPKIKAQINLEDDYNYNDFEEDEPFEPYKYGQINLEDGDKDNDFEKDEPFYNYNNVQINLEDDDNYDDFEEDEPFEPYKKAQINLKDDEDEDLNNDFNEEEPLQPYKKAQINLEDDDNDDDFEEDEPFEPYKYGQINLEDGDKDDYFEKDEPFDNYNNVQINLEDDDNYDDFEEDEPFEPYKTAQLNLKDDDDFIEGRLHQSYEAAKSNLKENADNFEDQSFQPYEREDLKEEYVGNEDALTEKPTVVNGSDKVAGEGGYNDFLHSYDITSDNGIIRLGANEFINIHDLDPDFTRNVNKDTEVFRKGMLDLYIRLADRSLPRSKLKESLNNIMKYLKGCFLPNVNLMDFMGKCAINSKKCFHHLLNWSAVHKYCNTSDGQYTLPSHYGKNGPTYEIDTRSENNFPQEGGFNGDDLRDTIKKTTEQLVHELVNSPNIDYASNVIKSFINYLSNKFPGKYEKELNLFIEMLGFASKQKTSQDIIKYLSNAAAIIKVEVPILKISEGLHKLIDFNSLSTPLKVKFKNVINYLVYNPRIASKIINDTEKNNENEFLFSLFKSLENEVALPVTLRQNLKALSEQITMKPKCEDEQLGDI